MRILHVIAGLNPEAGGVTRAVLTIAAGLSESGTINEIVTLDPPDADYLKATDFKIYALGRGKTSWCYNAQLLPWLRTNLSGYDAVITHGLWLYHVHAVRKARREIGVTSPPAYIMPHGMLDPYFQKAAGRRLKAIRNWLYWKVIESGNVHDAKALLYTCEEERRLAGESFSPFVPHRQLVVGLGVAAPPEYRPHMETAFLKASNLLSGERYILFLSRIDSKKGVDLLVNAYEHALQVFETSDELPKLVIGGPGIETTFGNAISEIVKSSPLLSKNVTFTGMLTGDAKWGAFYGCEAFILPSHQENFGIAIVEALACGRPVLISDQINIWREIEDGGCGFVSQDTFEGTVDLISRWHLLDPGDRASMGVRATSLYQKEFAVVQASRKLLAAMT